MKKKIVGLVGIALLGSLILGGKMGKAAVLSPKAWVTQEAARTSVHDPSVTSVIKDGKETFYIFGSHLAEAKSTNLKTWQVPFTTEYENPTNNLILGNLQENLKESFQWAGYDDADSKGGYSIWAPDVIWNPTYEWGNGDKGAFMYYYSTSSTWRRSCIGYAVSKTIEGPYNYVDTIIYSGFTQKDATDGSTRNVNYQNTNLKELIAAGKVSGFSNNWSKDNGLTYNTDYAPNAIDPALFYDANGKLWMTYGSWSGGIFILEMNPQTGAPVYPKNDTTNQNGQTIDRYFGTKLAGGYHKSGEGPFIVYDKTTQYYYLFETYGGLLSDGGYNMRLFRSKNPTGPFVDKKGQTPIFNSQSDNSQYGVKVMGNYQFAEMSQAYKAQGHNSAIITQSGQWHLVYHTRFSNSGEYHEVRVHSMYMNEELWPVVTPYEYQGNESKVTAAANLVGSYQFINHGTANGTTVLPTQTIQLTTDGKINGNATGTWQLKTGGLITLTINGVEYKGRAINQKTEGTTGKEVVTFSAIGTNNETIWGSKK